MHESWLRCAAAVSLMMCAACDTPTLPPGSTLTLAFESSVLYPATASTDEPSSKTACLDKGGAIVDLRAWLSDGSPAESVQVALWLEPALDARLIGLGEKCGGSDDVCLELDEGGTGQACLLPGEHFGTVTVFAHSGVVQQSKSIDVIARVLQSGSSLTIGISPIDLGLITPRSASSCGMPAAPLCAPPHPRHAGVTLLAKSPDGKPPPQDGTEVVVNVTAGWLSVDGSCSGAMSRPPGLRTTLIAGSTNMFWCFDDTASAGVASAQSGGVTGMAMASVSSIPASLSLTSSATTVAAGTSVTLHAVVTGCDGVGVRNTPVLFSATTSGAVITPASPVVTDDSGVATATATLTASTSIVAAVARAQSVQCPLALQVTPCTLIGCFSRS